MTAYYSKHQETEENLLSELSAEFHWIEQMILDEILERKKITIQ